MGSKPTFLQCIKEVLSDSINIILWHESEDINQKKKKKKLISKISKNLHLLQKLVEGNQTITFLALNIPEFYVILRSQ